MKFRKLRIAWSIAFGVASVLLIAMWVRSYIKCDELEWQRSETNLSFSSFRGSLGAFFMPYTADSQSLEFKSWQIGPDSHVDYNDGTGRPLPSFLGFKSSWVSAPIPLDTSTLVIPYWFPTFVCAVAAIAPWICQLSSRFSLRTVLIATTVVAVQLGLIAWLSR